MPISGPPPGIPQVPIGSIKIFRQAIEAAKIPVKVAVLPIGASPAGILRTLMLSGLAASALATFGIVTGDVETDMDDLIDSISEWLRLSRHEVGFSRGNRPERGPKELAIPLPIKPLKRGQTTDQMEPESDNDDDDDDEDRRPGQSYWTWLERRYGKPPKYNKGVVSHYGTQTF